MEQPTTTTITKTTNTTNINNTIHPNLAKNILESGGQIKPLYIPSQLIKGSGLCNTSLHYDGDKLRAIIRNVEYTLWISENKKQYQGCNAGPLVYIHRDDFCKLKTNNYYAEVNTETLEIERMNHINTSKLDIPPIWTFIGLEDARLIKWDNKFYACGVRRDTTTNGQGRMEMSELEITETHVKEVARNRVEVPDKTSYCEKNWMPIKDRPNHFVKWSNPTEIAILNEDKNSCTTIQTDSNKDAIKTPYDIRGGSQLIPWGDSTYLSIVHEVDFTLKNYNGQKDADYYHRFIIWDATNLTIKHISQPFNFLTGRIEFCIGLETLEDEHETIIIATGYYDNGTYLLKTNKQFINDFIKNSQGQNSQYQNPQKTIKFEPGFIPNLRNDNIEDLLKTHSLESQINDFVLDPYNPERSLILGYTYYKTIQQYAVAISFFLRCAEYTESKSLACEAMIYISICINRMEGRDHKEIHAIKHAISVKPDSAPANMICVNYYAWRGQHQDAYVAACNALEWIKQNEKQEPNPTTSPIPQNHFVLETPWYHGPQSLIIQKANCAEKMGKIKEARELYIHLTKEYPLSKQTREYIEQQLRKIPNRDCV